MYIPKDKYTNIDIVVEWKQGRVKGFRSKEEAERFINLICKKAAPDFEYSIPFFQDK